MRDRRLLSGAVGLSALGDFLGFIPLALYVQERTGSGIAVAGLFIALWAPSVVLGGPAGLLADRVESRRLLRDVSLGQAAIAAVLALTFGGLAATLALTALLGVGVALAQPAEFALVPATAGPGGVAAANGRIEAARYLGFTLGPVLGGLLAAAGGTPAIGPPPRAPPRAPCPGPRGAPGSRCWSPRRASWPSRGRRRRCVPAASRTAASVRPNGRATASPSCCTTAYWRRSSSPPSSR